jgi:hypothetical protein
MFAWRTLHQLMIISSIPSIAVSIRGPPQPYDQGHRYRHRDRCHCPPCTNRRQRPWSTVRPSTSFFPGIASMPQLTFLWLLKNNPFQAKFLRTISRPSSGTEWSRKGLRWSLLHIFASALVRGTHLSILSSPKRDSADRLLCGFYRSCQARCLMGRSFECPLLSCFLPCLLLEL